MAPKRRELREMVVIITGASAGIGKALAEDLSRRGSRLVLAARRLDRLEALNSSLGGRHLCVQADVGVREQCEGIVQQAVERFGRIDTLVCNAGYGILRRVADTSPAEMQRIFQTNLFGTLDCIRAAAPVMERQGPPAGVRGQMMIVSSAAARRGLPYFGAYSATKSAQLSLTEALRVEMRDRGIAVTSVHPVGTETDFGATASHEAGTTARITRNTGEVRQTAETVARAMVRAIEHPRPEVWPLGSSRWMLSLATLIPGWVDRVMAKRVVVEGEGGKRIEGSGD